jgi:hypothetical protein
MAEYDYIITVEMLIPPMGKLNYFAKVSHFYQRGGTNHGPFDNEFGETWGDSEEDARQKMIEKLTDWINRHPPI